MARGYYPLCPDLGPRWHWLSLDEQTRIHAFLITQLAERDDLPANVAFEVIPMQWHHLGEHFPVIGIPASDEDDHAKGALLSGVAQRLGEELSGLIREMGMDALRVRSAAQTLRWEDVHNLSASSQSND